MAATLRDNCDRQTLFFNFPHGTVEQDSQTITPTEVYILETIKFYAKYKYGDPGTCYISLQETTSGLPNGSLLTDRASFTVTADKVLKDITFTTQPTLQIDTKYAIVFEAPSGVASSKELHLYGEPASGSYYTGGDRVWYNGSVWTTVTSQDLNFYCWGSEAGPIKAKTPAPIDTATGLTLDYQQFSWESGSETPPDEEVYNVYWGTESGELDTLLLDEGSLTYMESVYLMAALGAGSYSITYYWRVDTYWPSTEQTAEGDEWTVSTIVYAPPRISYDLITGGSGAGPYDDPPGTEGTDWRWTGGNVMLAIRRLVAAVNNKIWYEIV